MNVREYLSARRAFSLVRQDLPASERITFEELAMLCHMANSQGPLRTSQIAEYQRVLRPTMTHRTSHLARLGLIVRTGSDADRRSVCCSLSERGAHVLSELLRKMCDKIKPPMSLARCTPDRMGRIVNAMGVASLSSADLVLLGLMGAEGGEGLAVSDLVDSLGLLQPTVSMAVASLTTHGRVRRAGAGAPRGGLVLLTDEGRARALAITEEISSLRVKNARSSRTA